LLVAVDGEKGLRGGAENQPDLILWIPTCR
jgi:hypothetical protein